MSARITPDRAGLSVGNGALIAAGLWSLLGLLAAIVAILKPPAETSNPFDPQRIPLFAAGLAMAGASYLLRIFRWHRLIVPLMPGLSMRKTFPAQIAAFGLSVTPARVGEAAKLQFVRQGTDVPLARLAPLLIVERLVEGVSFIALALGAGLFLFPATWLPANLLVAQLGFLAVIAAVVLLNVPSARDWLLRRLPQRSGGARFSTWLHDFVAGCWDVFGIRTVLEALALSIGARLCDAVVLDLAVRSMGRELPPLAAVFVHGSAGTAGGVSMLPGGVGVVEAATTGMLAQFDVPLGDGLSAILLTRAATLWLWVAVGLAVLFIGMDKRRRSGESPLPPEDG